MMTQFRKDEKLNQIINILTPSQRFILKYETAGHQDDAYHIFKQFEINSRTDQIRIKQLIRINEVKASLKNK
jgi:hypothetical protein